MKKLISLLLFVVCVTGCGTHKLTNQQDYSKLLTCTDPTLPVFNTPNESMQCLEILKSSVQNDKNWKIKLDSGGGLAAIVSNTTNPNRDWLLRFFIANGADINQLSPSSENEYKYSGLHACIFISDKTTLAFLLQHGADPLVRSRKGHTALDIARKVHAKKPTADSLAVLQLLEKATAEAEAAKVAAK